MFCPDLIPVLQSFVPFSGARWLGDLQASDRLWEAAGRADLSRLDNLAGKELHTFRYGKDCVIGSLCDGASGYPSYCGSDSAYEAIYEAGSCVERRDLRAWLHWSKSLDNCALDYAKGVRD